METTIVVANKGSQTEENLFCIWNKDLKSRHDNMSFLESRIKNTRVISKHPLRPNEKYLRRFIELIRITASKAASRNISLHLDSNLSNFGSRKIKTLEDTNGEGSKSLVSSCFSRGTLQCTWVHGIPHYIFSLDDSRDVHVANLLTVDSSDGKSLEYVYLFRSGISKPKKLTGCNDVMPLVGKMKATDSLSPCAMDIEFVLFGIANNYRKQKFKKNVLRSNEDNLVLNENNEDGAELLSIVAKSIHIQNSNEMLKGDGWGMKFLKYIVCYPWNMDILIPSGLHGGTNMYNCIPSSLIQRWKSGGGCDCGGWDIGCPLIVLNARLDKQDQTDVFKQGSAQSAPTVKLEKINEGLSYVHFHSSLSALQSFSIVVAIIHTSNSAIKQKNTH